MLRPVRTSALALVAAVAIGCTPQEAPASSYPDVAALSAALAEADMTCELEYEGLADGDREVSTCTLDGEFALLQVWSDTDALAEFLELGGAAQGARASGVNWLIDVETVQTAARVAAALDGDVSGAAASTTAP